MDWTEDTGDDMFVLMRTKKTKTASTSDELLTMRSRGTPEDPELQLRTADNR